MQVITAKSILELLRQIQSHAQPPCRIVIDPSGRTLKAALLKPEEKQQINGIEPWVIIDVDYDPTIDELADAVVNQLMIAYEDKCSDCDWQP
jgi:uncharacterized protein involved in exopolysaccharide biosynthesis